MKPLLRIVLIGALLILLDPAVASSAREEFNQARARFAECTKAEDLECAAESAEKSYKAGKEVFGKHDVNTANLGINLGRTLNRRGFRGVGTCGPKQFRSAPRFENGVAVATEQVRNKIDFDLHGLVRERRPARMR